MWHQVILLSLMLNICLAQNETSLATLLADIFTTDPNAFNSTRQTPSNKPTKPNEQDTYKSCGNQKECVPRWLCANDTINTSGINIIDIRINTESTCGYLEICCDVSNKRDEPIIMVPKENPAGCGYQNPRGVGFKITGASDEAEFGEFPWMVAILYEESSTGNTLNLYQCGGALIAPNVVLTAAHCVTNREPNSLVARAGEWDTQTKTEIYSHEDSYVKEIVYHEQFNKGALYNDIALLFLETPITLQENIQPICLPRADETFDYSRCYATGWGKNKFGKEGEYQVILKKIDLPVVPSQQCQKNLRTTRLGKHFILDNSFICAGGEKDKDTCKGDGGSPLVCPVKGQANRFYQAGIVAWGIGCGEENIPGVYANVAYLRRWIDQKLNERDINAAYFTI